jgi:hypothetical protein
MGPIPSRRATAAHESQHRVGHSERAQYGEECPDHAPEPHLVELKAEALPDPEADQRGTAISFNPAPRAGRCHLPRLAPLGETTSSD